MIEFPRSEHVATLPDGITDPQVPITYFAPFYGNDQNKAVLIFPGGGYQMLATIKEGEEYAKTLCAQGVHAFVVNYRLAPDGFRHPAMLEDALAALLWVQQNAKQWGYDPDKVGLLGSSAGGHLAGHLATSPDEWDNYGILPPLFLALAYPVVSMDREAHSGSRNNLLGPDHDPAAAEALSIHRRIHHRMPRTYIVHAVDDAAVTVENSLFLAAALRRADTPFEIHLYEKGGHGFGMRTVYPWKDDLIRFVLASGCAPL